MTIQTAIEKATEQGWRGCRNNQDLPCHFCLDPTFWQALGKAMGKNSSVVVTLCGKQVIVDLTTKAILEGYYWELTPKGYLRGKPVSGGKKIFLHRLVMDAQLGEFVDHINGNRLDNRNANLQLVTLKQNGLHKTKTKLGKYRGVTYNLKTGKWQGQVRFERKTYSAGYFKDKDEAAIQTEILRQKLFGKWHNPKPNRDWWLETWHRLIDHLAKGGSIELFFETL